MEDGELGNLKVEILGAFWGRKGGSGDSVRFSASTNEQEEAEAGKMVWRGREREREGARRRSSSSLEQGVT